MPKKKRREVLETLTLDQLIFLKKHWGFWARPDQLPPEGDWLIWLLLGGRGAGKTRAGAEWVRSKVEGPTPLQKGKYRHIALVGETILSVREVMIEGPSGLRAIAPEETRPTLLLVDSCLSGLMVLKHKFFRLKNLMACVVLSLISPGVMSWRNGDMTSNAGTCCSLP